MTSHIHHHEHDDANNNIPFIAEEKIVLNENRQRFFFNRDQNRTDDFMRTICLYGGDQS